MIPEGARVKYIGEVHMTGPQGEGVIVSSNSVNGVCLVEFDNAFLGGHDGNGSLTGKVGRGWYVDEADLEVITITASSSDKAQHLPEDAAARKNIPLCTGVLDYFPNALIYLAEISKAGNDQHNPNQPLHWSRSKSTDHDNCILRHQVDRGGFDTDGKRHSGKVAWRALAQLEEELIAAGAKPGRGTR